MRESMVERHLRERIEKAGGKCWKWVSPGRRGVPDRIVIMPNGVIAFVETKAPGKTEEKLQKVVHRYLVERGALVFPSVDSYAEVDYVVNYLTYKSLQAGSRNGGGSGAV